MKFWKISYIIFTIVILISGCAYGNEKNTNLPDEPDSAASTDWMGDELLREETDCADLSAQWEPNPDESLYEYNVELEEIPELSYRNASGLDYGGKNYICYKDILILINTIYKKQAGKYVKQELTLNAIFDIGDEWSALDCKQYHNLCIAQSEDNKSFLIYDLDTHSKYCCYSAEEDMMIGPFWYIYDGCIYYSEWACEGEKERTLKKNKSFK